MDVQNLVALYPRLFHMAEAGTWPSIRQHGLLSTNEVARRSGLDRRALTALRTEHRPDKTTVTIPGVGAIVLRDQKPMEPIRLERALEGGVTAAQWYELINGRVFFWAEEHRLLRLLGARQYRHLEHDVLTVDTASLVNAHADRIRLCHMNSGNTFPMPHARGLDTFMTIADYPVNRNGKPLKPVVEVTVLDHVLDFSNHVRIVRSMKGADVLRTIFIA